MKLEKFFGLFALAFSLIVFGCNSKQSAVDRVFSMPLPEGVEVINYGYQSMGPDCAEVFVLKATGTAGDKLLKKLVEDWKLSPTDEPSSAFDRSASWWPNHAKRTAMDEKFQNFDENEMEFRSVWVNSNGLIYVERGEW